MIENISDIFYYLFLIIIVGWIISIFTGSNKQQEILDKLEEISDKIDSLS